MSDAPPADAPKKKNGWGGARANSGGARPNSGGKRPGAGRPTNAARAAKAAALLAASGAAPTPPAPPPVVPADADAPLLDPLSWMRRAMNDPRLDMGTRAKLAIELAKIENPRGNAARRPPALGKKQVAKEAAGIAVKGRFAPSAPPRLVGGTG